MRRGEWLGWTGQGLLALALFTLVSAFPACDARAGGDDRVVLHAASEHAAPGDANEVNPGVGVALAEGNADPCPDAAERVRVGVYLNSHERWSPYAQCAWELVDRGRLELTAGAGVALNYPGGVGALPLATLTLAYDAPGPDPMLTAAPAEGGGVVLLSVGLSF